MLVEVPNWSDVQTFPLFMTLNSEDNNQHSGNSKPKLVCLKTQYKTQYKLNTDQYQNKIEKISIVEKKVENMKIILFLFSFLLCVIAQDSECEKGFECVPARGCFHYINLNDRLKQLQQGSTEFKKIRSELASLVCNKAKRKICCDIIDTPSWIPKPNEDVDWKCGLELSWVTGGSSQTEFIVGGNDTKLGQFPWTVLLGSFNEDTKKIEFTCGGTLINRW